jgi:hypothetical protein
MKRWIARVILGVAIAFAALYAGDWLVFKARGSPSSTVTVNRMMVVPLKGNKNEYDYMGSGDEACSVSIFPQAGLPACWRLRRNPNQTTNL